MIFKYINKINTTGLMRWLLLSSLTLVFFGEVSQEVPQDIHSPSNIYSVDSNQSVSKKIHNSELLLFCKDFKDIEIEEDQNHSSRKLYQPLSLPLVIKEITSVSLCSSKKLIKLFILFHSWKSFLHI